MAPQNRSVKKNGLIHKATSCHPALKDVLQELKSIHGKSCMLCKKKVINEKLYGPLYQFNDCVVHYFCILLSSKSVQNGTDKEGILGFLPKDIKTELRRGSRKKCTYCKKLGATISCSKPRCNKNFHLPCGLRNGSMHQFFNTFKSYCQTHRITQKVDIQDLQQSTPVECLICRDDVLPSPTPSSIWAPCCKCNIWFHRDCIQNMALSAGYFFKCPMCNNDDLFKSTMLTLGIYIPSRDASWETVPNAYAELSERPNTCHAVTCLCPAPEKRNYHLEIGSWSIKLCHGCGSQGTHLVCSFLKYNKEWYCKSCHLILASDITMNECTSNDDNHHRIIPQAYIDLTLDEGTSNGNNQNPINTHPSFNIRYIQITPNYFNHQLIVPYMTVDLTLD